MKGNFYLIIKELFNVLSGGAVIFLLLEIARPRLVSAYLNLNWWLVVWLFCGIIILFDDGKN